MKDLSKTDLKDIMAYKNAVAIVVVIAVLLLLLFTSYTNYQDNIQGVKNETRLLQEAEREVRDWQQLEREYNNLVRGFFEQEISFRRYVEEKAKASGVKINSLRISSTQEDFYQIPQMRIELISSYEDFVNFIKKLEEKNIFAENIALSREDVEVVKALVNLKTITIVR